MSDNAKVALVSPGKSLATMQRRMSIEAHSTRPLVTLICPVYNDAVHCRAAIESVLSQTYTNFKFVILNNGSSDQTSEVLDSYRDPRLEIIKSHINLRSEIMTELMRNATTEYIAQIYSDDVFLPDKLMIMLSALEESGADACFSNNVFIDDDGYIIDNAAVPKSQFVGDVSSMSAFEHLYHFYSKGNSLHPVAMVIRTEAYRALGGVRPYMHQIGDMEFFARLLISSKVIFLPQKLQKIRIKSRGTANESEITPSSISRIYGERMRFINVFRSPEALSVVEKIFLPEIIDFTLPDDLREWFLAHQLLKIDEPDYKIIGMETLYDALDKHFCKIETYVTSTRGITLSQYIGQISSDVIKPFRFMEHPATTSELERLNQIIVERDCEIIRLSGVVADISSRQEGAKKVDQTAELEQLTCLNNQILNSTSWRLTAPFRKVVTLLRGR